MTQPLSELERQRRHYKAVRARLWRTSAKPEPPAQRGPEPVWAYSGKVRSFCYSHEIEGPGLCRTGRDIAEAACRAFKLTMPQLIAPRRLRHIVKMRQATMYLINKYASISYLNIGRILGHRDHTTVMHGIACVMRHPAEFAPLLTAIEAELARGE